MVSRYRGVPTDHIVRLGAIQHRAKLVGRLTAGPADTQPKPTAHADRSVEPMGRASPYVVHVFTCSLSELRKAVCIREPRAQTMNHYAD